MSDLKLDLAKMSTVERFNAATAEIAGVCEKYQVQLQSSTIESDGVPATRGPVIVKVLALESNGKAVSQDASETKEEVSNA